MARSLANVKTNAIFAATLLDAVDAIDQIAAAYSGTDLDHKPVWATGTGDGQADRVWVEKGLTLASAATFNLDLYDFAGRDIGKGSGLDAAGLAMALAEIAYIGVFVTSTGSGKLRLGGEGSGAAWNSGFGGSDSAVSHDIGEGGSWQLVAWNDGDLAVADSTNHLLKFLGVTADVTFDIIILGRSS
jgi:hypothetical protein